MKCLRCNKKREYKEFCMRCHKKIVEKKLRKKLRSAENLKIGARVLVLDKATKHFIKVVLKHKYSLYEFPTHIKQLDDRIFKYQPLLDFVKEKKIDIVLLPWTLDHEIHSFISSFVNGKKQDYNKKFLKLYEDYTIEDIKAFFSPKIRFLPRLKSPIIENFSIISYPDAKYSFLKAIKEFKKIEKC